MFVTETMLRIIIHDFSSKKVTSVSRIIVSINLPITDIRLRKKKKNVRMRTKMRRWGGGG